MVGPNGPSMSGRANEVGHEKSQSKITHQCFRGGTGDNQENSHFGHPVIGPTFETPTHEV